MNHSRGCNESTGPVFRTSAVIPARMLLCYWKNKERFTVRSTRLWCFRALLNSCSTMENNNVEFLAFSAIVAGIFWVFFFFFLLSLPWGYRLVRIGCSELCICCHPFALARQHFPMQTLMFWLFEIMRWALTFLLPRSRHSNKVRLPTSARLTSLQRKQRCRCSCFIWLTKKWLAGRSLSTASLLSWDLVTSHPKIASASADSLNVSFPKVLFNLWCTLKEKNNAYAQQKPRL